MRRVASAIDRVRARFEEVASVKDYSAQVNGTTDDSAPTQKAATTGLFTVPPGTLKTDTAITGSLKLIGFNATFSGANALDANFPTFGPGVLRAICRGTDNCITGIAHNNAAESTNAEPVGVTGYGRNDNGGNAVFGLFGRADQYGATGSVQNEVNSFNLSSANPSMAFPVDRSIGTAQQVPTALIVAAGGTKNSHTGIFIGGEGGSPQSFLNGIHADATKITNYLQVLSNGSSLLHWIKPDGSGLLANLTVPETAAASISTPASGYQTLFIDTADHKLKRKDSSGTVTTIA
jgi:hypothetical protein